MNQPVRTDFSWEALTRANRNADHIRNIRPITPAEVMRLKQKLTEATARFTQTHKGHPEYKARMAEVFALRGQWRNAEVNLGIRGQGIALTLGPSAEEMELMGRISYTPTDQEKDR